MESIETRATYIRTYDGQRIIVPELRTPDRLNRGSIGGYITLEDTLASFGDGRRLDGWVRGGVADRRFNTISAYVGGGAVLHGVADMRDAMGFGIAHADLSRGQTIESGGIVGTDSPGSGTETTVELSYQRPFSDHLTVQPDIQYVSSPGGAGIEQMRLLSYHASS